MTQHRAIIEFWIIITEPDQVSFLARLETTAPPPDVGETLNFLSKDYIVHKRDFTIDGGDRPFSGVTYRRNVYLKFLQGNA